MSEDRLSKSVIWSIILFLCIVGIYGYLRSSQFALREIRVVGNRRLASELLVARSGMTPGPNIFTLPLKEVTQELEQDPMVSRVTIKRRLPGTVLIEVKERNPIFLISGTEGLCYVGDEGVVIGVVDRGEADLPVVNGVAEPETNVGTSLQGTGLSVTLEMYRYGKNIWELLSEINVSNPEDVFAFTNDLSKVKFGDGTNMERKIKVLSNLLSSSGGFKEIDLTIPDTPVVKKR